MRPVKYILVLATLLAAMAFNASALPKTKAAQVSVDPSGISGSTNTTVQGVLEDLDSGLPSAATTTNAGIVELASDAEVEAGTAENLAITPAQLKNYGGLRRYLYVREEQPAGTDGSSTATTLTTVVLNTEKTNTISGASVSTNQITLPAGIYRISARVPHSATGTDTSFLKAVLYNVTDDKNEIVGATSASNCGIYSTFELAHAFVTGPFSIASEKTFEIRQISDSTDHKIGRAVNLGSLIEVYSEVEIWKIE